MIRLFVPAMLHSARSENSVALSFEMNDLFVHTGSAIQIGPAVCCDLTAEPNCATTPAVLAGWTIIVDLLKGGATWHSRIAEDHGMREYLLETILHSKYSKISEGYERALEFQWNLNLPHLSIIRASSTRVMIALPPLPGYTLPAWNEQESGETITVQPITSYLIDSSYTGPTVCARADDVLPAVMTMCCQP